MASQDLHNNVKILQGVPPVAAYTGNTAVVSNIIDMGQGDGYEALEWLINIGTLSDADASWVVTMDDGNVSNLSDAAAVDANFILGTYALAGFTFASDNTTKKIGYVGNKRYVRLTITGTNNTGNAYFDVLAVLGFPRNPPV